MLIETDVCVMGAGPGGCATAIQLAKLGIKNVLVDKAIFPRDKICGDALSGKVMGVFNKIDPTIAEEFSKQDTQIGSWGVKFVAPNGQALRVPFRQNFDKEQSPPGFIAKRFDFDNFLINQTKRFPEIQLLQNTDIIEHTKTTNGWVLKDKNDIIIHAKILIASNGAHSHFAKEFGGIEMEPAHYCAGIRGYYTGVTHLDPDNFIELHFVKDFLPGYFWIFPLANGLANVGVGVASDTISNKKIHLKKRMLEIIQEHPEFKERFKDAQLVDTIKGYGLPLGSKKRIISGDNFMLVGDAASLIDPFTGEGIGNAVISGMLAAKYADQCLTAQKFDAAFMQGYDALVYKRLWSELSLSRQMQKLINYPFLFNMVVNKANKSKLLRETISSMFENIDLRNRLQNPIFYFKLLFTNS
ncbi:MAG TPA: geranylgeranyl reductase family protein [Ferruginibacter sp.]|jgi:geranylgeranyl reductase family protein|nr:geranylgeranyl reductase family protein [Ferruginibacter sp.]